MKKDLLLVENLSAGYGSYLAVRNVSLHVKKNEIVAIIGPNGAGKSSLLKAIVGLINPVSGVVKFKGQKIIGMPTYKLIRMGIALIPEHRRLFPNMSVLENLELGAYLLKGKEKTAERMSAIFKKFPILRERKQQLACTLSGGEQQMLSIGRGLMIYPELCLIDEPSVGLAPIIIQKVYETIKGFRDEGITTLLVEQNVNAALSVADRLYIMQNAVIIHEDTPDCIAKNKDLCKAFLMVD